MQAPNFRNSRTIRRGGGVALSAILAIILVPLSPATAWANDPAGQAGEVVQASAASEAPTETSVASVASGDSTLYYDTLEDAVDNAADGSVVTLLQNVEINAPITVASNITLSLDGHTVTNNVS